jgi:hypothetical protein
MTLKIYSFAFIWLSTVSISAFAGTGQIQIKGYTAYACSTVNTSEGTTYKISIFPVDPDNSESQAKENAQAAQGLISASAISSSIVIELKPVLSTDQMKSKIEEINKKICDKLGYEKNDPNYSEKADLKFQKVEIAASLDGNNMILKSIKIATGDLLAY